MQPTQYAIRYTIYDIRYTGYANRRNTPNSAATPNKPPILPKLSTNYELIITNKPNFRKDKMNLNSYSTKDYENKTLSRSGKNKANSKPIQTQNEPNFKGKKISRPANPATRRKDEQIISRKDEQAYRRKDEQIISRKDEQAYRRKDEQVITRKDEQVSRRKEKGEVRR